MNSDSLGVLLTILIIMSCVCFTFSLIFSIIGLVVSGGFKRYPSIQNFKITNGMRITNLIFFIIETILLIAFVVFLVIFLIGMNEYSNIYGYYGRNDILSMGMGLLVAFVIVNLFSVILSLSAFVSGNKASAMGKALIASGRMPQYVPPTYAIQPQPYIPQPQYQPNEQFTEPSYAPAPQKQETEKYCTQCGAKNLGDSRFCTNCGSNF